MKRSTDRILATHAGALPRPDDLKDMVFAKARGETYDPNALARRLRESVAEVVRHQIECGMDFVNDGEISKTNFTNYCRERLTGFETRHFGPGEGPPPLDISGRDEKLFPEYFASGRGNTIGQAGRTQAFCVAPLTFTGEAALAADIDNFKAALKGTGVTGFMNANTPGTIEHWLHDEYYKNTKDFLFAIAEAMRPEYLAIIEAGFMLQIDDPDLPDGWQMFPEMSVADYRAYAQLRVDALNHALRGIPKDMVQLHVCWGSFHGPHQNDIPLADIIDIVFGVHAERFSIEASNPMHEHEWHLFEKVKLPANAVLVPGVVGHCTDFIEHPDLVAERIERYANLVGKENVVAGTDCGIGPRVGHGKIAWAKLKSIAEGARHREQTLVGQGGVVHAIVVEETGGPEKLLWREVPEPVPGPGQVSVRLALTSVNFADVQARRGTGVTKTPFTPGLDGMGTIVAAGAGVERLHAGDRVSVNPEGGSYAEIVVAQESLVYPVGPEISDEAAASVTVLVTAWNILHRVARIGHDETVLVHAAAGGVGSVLVQMARAAGAGRIFATAGGEKKLEIARDFGADVAIDYTKDDFAARITELTGGRGVDVICDAIGGDVFAKGLGVLADFGRHVVYGQSGGGPGSLTTDKLHRSNRAVLGYSSGHYRRNRPLELRPSAGAAFKLVAEGKVKILEGGRFALKDVAQAHELVQNRGSVGRVFLTL